MELFPGFLTLFLTVVTTKGSTERYPKYLMYNYKYFIYKKNYNTKYSIDTQYLIDHCHISIYK